ncbi:hemerythrin domain-containing protein [Myxococcus sp. K15C18031901]|uniref:hemerythrin domain-containing protein n=1 Tax=Myxococcus dinghuensis TaxID=2906761 RepID=UPI0020A739E4|nr:hemerythrin domain-containing protein [Myxococcus dinghuensis]MCP3103068.1 hemerythrin domain-containing protein [Myxococcus dinghuensis]
MGGPFDILVRQHRELEARFEHLWADAETADVSSREAPRERVDALVELLRLHLRLEERCLLPRVARVEGRARARLLEEDHLAMRELMDELVELSPEQPEAQARLYALEDLLVAHFQEEESEVLPRVITTLEPHEQHQVRAELATTRDELRSLGAGVPLSEESPLLDTLRWDG